jgi:hypothetical protein
MLVAVAVEFIRLELVAQVVMVAVVLREILLIAQELLVPQQLVVAVLEAMVQMEHHQLRLLVVLEL